jgi:hypothetical protein
MRYMLTLLSALLLAGCSTRPVFVSEERHTKLQAGEPIRITFAADSPAPADAKRFAFTIRQIGVGSQKDLNNAIEEGKSNARDLGANHLHIAISEPEARRQKVEVSFFRVAGASGGNIEAAPEKRAPTIGAPTKR